MLTLTTLSRLLGAAACAVAFSGCTTAPAAAPTLKLQEMLSLATQAAGAGQHEKAVDLWKQAATAYPADKTSWNHIAQSRFESGKFGEAIVSAEEVLVRDPNDKNANEIIAMSALRLSNRAFGVLIRQNTLSASMRSESQEMAKTLRESLADSPSPVLTIKPAVADRIKARKKMKVLTDAAASADPFSNLK